METVALVAPVTALEFLRDEFLLTGEGPVLSAYSLQPHPRVCASLGVLQHHRIHGIRPRRQAAESAQSSHVHNSHATNATPEPVDDHLAVFGGKSVRLLRLRRDLKDKERLRLEPLGPLVELQDWALDVRWLSGDSPSLLCVAAAHNSVLLLNIVKGRVVVQRSCQEGCLLYSALLLVHESWSDTVLVGGTVFNQLILWKPGGGGGGDSSSVPEDKAPVERRLLGHSGVIFSISCLQEEGHLASASDDRSVRLWSVGAVGGAGGECGDANPTCLRVLYGHQARVFSVHLSPGKVFSAGEDGACLVWAGDGSVVRTLKGHRAGGVRALAVSDVTVDGARWVATGGADGGVRLWSVEGSAEEESVEDAKTEKVTDLDFPGDGLPKTVCTVGEEPENTSWAQVKFVVCTDKGSVSQYSNGRWEVIWQGPPDFQSYCVMETAAVTIKQSAVKVYLCAVANLSGSVQVFPTCEPRSGVPLTAGSGKVHSLIWLKAEDGAYLLASGAEGLVYRWLVEVTRSETSSLVIGVAPLPPFLLPPCAKRWLTAAVLVLSTAAGMLWVCGDRRGSLVAFQESGTLKTKEERKEGRSERLLADRKQPAEENSAGAHGLALQPLSCLFGVHGKQGVTSVCEYRGLLYSTGRDGCVRVFRVRLGEGGAGGKDGPRLEVLRVQRACKGMEWLERILFLEPEASEEVRVREGGGPKQPEGHGGVGEKGREARFVIVGFHAVHFVVWDPVRQHRLLAVPCGGGHRSWSLWPCHEGFWHGYGAVVFIKQGAVLASQPPARVPGCTGRARTTGGWGLREGVHGRGIGCVCRLGRIREGEREHQGGCAAKGVDGGKVTKGGRQWEVVVTGGEDTCLSVLAVNPTTGGVRVLSVITDHISSVRTVAACSDPGRGSRAGALTALLVSAGGRAQLQCYRLLVTWDAQRRSPSCQVIQVAGHRLDAEWERRRNRHKTVKMDPETRYMCIAVVDETADCVFVSASCSDGAIRLFSISETERRIDLLWETFYHQRCVLSVATCCLEDDKGNRYKLLFSAATDGEIAVWHLTDASFSSVHNASGATTPPVPCLTIPAHQSGVNSLAVWAEDLGQQGAGCLVTVASGGDDGQLTVSTVRVQYPDDGATGGSRGCSQTSEAQLERMSQLQPRLHSQARVALAHAAPLTALRLLSPSLAVTTSSDQRVCLWKVSGTGVSHSGALCSHVADAAGLAVWEEEEGDNVARTESEDEFAGRGGEESGSEGETADGVRGGGGGGREGSQEEADEVEDGDPPGTGSQRRGHEKGGEATNQTENDSGRKSETNTETHSRDGWVLVCGQGFQLLRIQHLNSDAGLGREQKGDGRENLLKVTL